MLEIEKRVVEQLADANGGLLRHSSFEPPGRRRAVTELTDTKESTRPKWQVRTEEFADAADEFAIKDGYRQ
jgi:hypothetical protein